MNPSRTLRFVVALVALALTGCAAPAPQPSPSAVETRQTLNLDTQVLFDYGTATLTRTASAELQRVAAAIQATGTRGQLEVTGHTDADGDSVTNWTLSQQRAQAVADALHTLLGEGYTFVVRGAGEEEPIATNCTVEGKALNRRVTVTLPN